VNFILAIPLGVRLALLFLLGAVAGAIVNWAVYTLAWNRRAISPWSATLAGAPPRRASDRVPIVGWLGLRREEPLHGGGFWIRPLVIELVAALAFAGLYALEIERGTRLWPAIGNPPQPQFLHMDLPLVAHAQFASHILLFCLMLAASLVDLDEKTIPDLITVAGTVAALALAAVFPWSLLLAGYWQAGGAPAAEFLTLASPNPWPVGLDGLPQRAGLAIALGAWTLWCGGLMPRVWKGRRGFRWAVRIFVQRLRTEWVTYEILLLWLLGVVGIAVAAWRLPAAHWASLLTSLVGMIAGGGAIWIVRVVGQCSLKKEAMGFGDVTLMSMIGAFVGWQACVIVFFLAPFFGLVLAVVNLVLRGEHEIPYGPFLCLAALGTVLKWPTLWNATFDVFALGSIVPVILGASLLLMAPLLLAYRLLAERMTSRR
jgi:prepilin signal peptidase PulO-like enzyme (type II secretory pathway)